MNRDTKRLQTCELSNSSGMRAEILNYGATLKSIHVPDRNGVVADVVLGFDSAEEYVHLGNRSYFGSIVGRYANRIAGSKFQIGTQVYRLTPNEPPNHLHGGKNGFAQKIWNMESVEGTEWAGVRLSYKSPHNEEGYPGNLDVEVVYRLFDQNVLQIECTAETDQATVVNLTSHCYFNLSGAQTINQHSLQIFADQYLPINDQAIPTGELQKVAGTCFDFNTPVIIEDKLDMTDPQIKLASGFDHCWVLRGDVDDMKQAAVLQDESSGRRMDVFTTEPGVQYYSGNHLDGVIGKQNYRNQSGLCLETQHFPNSPNCDQFPSTLLVQGKTYRTTTELRFTAD